MSQDADALERAITLACWAHQGQRYPSPEAEPYILHPLRVMLAVEGFRAQMAAVLHDVIEDTEVGPGRLREAGLPGDVVAAVVALTHRPGEGYGQYIEKVQRGAEHVQEEQDAAGSEPVAQEGAGWHGRSTGGDAVGGQSRA